MPVIKVSYTLPVCTEQEGDLVVASCLLLDIHSQGENEQEAIDSLAEALQLFFETCQERGTLDAVLRDCGLKRVDADNAERVDTDNTDGRRNVDVSLLIGADNVRSSAYC